MRQPTKLLDADGGMLIQPSKQEFHGFVNLQEGTFGAFTLFPGHDQYLIGQDILIRHTDISLVLLVFIGSRMGTISTGGDIDLQHGLAIHIPSLRLERHHRTGVHLRGCLDHVILLIASYASDRSIIFHSDQQPATIGVGKGTQCAGNLLTIAYLKLEVELLVLSLCDQLLYWMSPLHFGSLFGRQS